MINSRSQWTNKLMVSLLICWQMRIQRLQTSSDCTLILSLPYFKHSFLHHSHRPSSSQPQIPQLLTIFVWSDQAQDSRWEEPDSHQDMPGLLSCTSLSHKLVNTSLTSGILICNIPEHSYLGLSLWSCLRCIFPCVSQFYVWSTH